MSKNIWYLSLLFPIGIAIGYWLSPTKTEVKIVEKEIRHHVDTTTRINERPNGTRTTIIVEKDRTTELSTEKTNKTANKKVSKWIATALIGINYESSAVTLDYQNLTISLQRDLFLGLSAGPWISLDGNFGLGLSIRF